MQKFNEFIEKSPICIFILTTLLTKRFLWFSLQKWIERNGFTGFVERIVELKAAKTLAMVEKENEAKSMVQHSKALYQCTNFLANFVVTVEWPYVKLWNVIFSIIRRRMVAKNYFFLYRMQIIWNIFTMQKSTWKKLGSGINASIHSWYEFFFIVQVHIKLKLNILFCLQFLAKSSKRANC